MFGIKLTIGCILKFRFVRFKCRFECRFWFVFGFAFGFGFSFALRFRFRFGLKKWHKLTSFRFILDYSEIRLKWSFEVLTSRWYQTMKCNAIWETCGTKLISVCIYRKLRDVITSTVYMLTICLARFRSQSSSHKDLGLN